MAITVPVPATMVSVSLWGKPITDETNRITPIANGVNIVGYANLVAKSIPGGYVQTDLAMNATGSIAKGITFATTGFTVLTAGVYLLFGQFISSGTAPAGADHSINFYRGATNVVSCTMINPAANSWVPGTCMGMITASVNDVITVKGASGVGTNLDNRSVVGIKWMGQ